MAKRTDSGRSAVFVLQPRGRQRAGVNGNLDSHDVVRRPCRGGAVDQLGSDKFSAHNYAVERAPQVWTVSESPPEDGHHLTASARASGRYNGRELGHGLATHRG